VLKASPPTVLVLGFLALILAGTVLLWLPVSQRQPVSLFAAFFTATSAVTVTGLSIIDPGTDLSTFGQMVLLLLIQLGGLGFVTFAVISAITLGKRMSLRQQNLALQAFNQTSVTKIQSTAIDILKISLLIELLVAACLTVWWSRSMSWGHAAYQALFHTVSAFNNAGFGLYPDSLARFTTDPVSLAILCVCIIAGGLGFGVISELLQKRRWAGLMPYTKAVLVVTLILNLAGLAAFWLLERVNPQTLGGLGAIDQMFNAWFYSVTSRTAGFATLDVSHFHDSSTLIIMILMFIGGGSLSTAGGIKTGTFMVLLAAVYSYARRKPEVTLFRRSISADTIQKSLALLLVTVFLVLGGVITITILEQERTPFISIVFEVVSAIATTGLSRNTTGVLSEPSQAILTLLMFAGRLGPLTLVYSLATQNRSRVRYPETEFQVG
jgi:trk system potassium uptake protein TrkH